MHHGEVVTKRQMGYQAAEQEEGKRNHCSDDMNEATLQIESPSTATSTTTTAQVLSSTLMDNPPTCYHLQPTSDYLDSVTGRFLQPQLSSATAVAAAPGSNCSSMLITDESMGEIPSDIERFFAEGYSTGDGTPSYEGVCVVERLDNLELMNCLDGDDDFEFLRSILNDADDSPAPGDIINMPTMLPPTPVPALYKLVEEQELRIADEVAACIWLAEERFQERLLARATDTWAMIEAVPQVIHATGRGLSEEIADRLKATRQAVKVQLKMADDFARVRGRTLIVEPDRGTDSNILREDLITSLEMLRIGNVMGGHRLSVTECHQELVERLRGIREAVIDRITENHKAAMTAVGVHGKQFSPVTSDDELLMGIDSVIQSSLQQLKATYISFEDALQSTRARGRLHASQPSWGTTPEDTQEGSKSDSSMSDTPSVKQGKRTRAGPNATDVKSTKKRKPGSGGRRCKNQDCSLHPHFGFTRPEYCSRHKLPGMFNVKGRRCNDPECSRTPVYGKRGDPHPTYCATHKLAGMVDIKNPTCREPSCSRQPSFGSPQDRRATYCAMHMEEGMVNVRRMLATRSSSRSSQAMGAAKDASTSTP